MAATPGNGAVVSRELARMRNDGSVFFFQGPRGAILHCLREEQVVQVEARGSYQERILQTLNDQYPLSKSELLRKAGGNYMAMCKAVNCLLEKGLIEQEQGPRGACLLKLASEPEEQNYA
jgi:predicted transcriptional regulator